MGQATLRAVGATGSNTAGFNSVSASSPASTAAGDLLVAFVTESAETPATPSGWTAGPKNGVAGAVFLTYTFWKWATAPGAASTTFSWTTPAYAVAAVVAVSGMNNVGNPVSASAVSDTTLTVPSMTSTRGSGLLLTAHASNASPYSAPAAMVEIADLSHPSIGLGVEINQRGADTSPQGAQVPSSVPAYSGTPASLGLIVSQDNVAPNAPILTSPANSSTIDLAATQRFALTFSDPGDSQSALSIRYRLGAGSWVTVNDTTPNGFHDFPPATFAAGAYEWQAQTTDNGSPPLTGPLSASSFFTAANAPGVPTITAPTNGSTIALATGNLTWSATTQTAYQVRKVADVAGAADPTTIYWDSGEVTNSATRTLALTFPVNNRWDHLQIRVKAAGLWSAWADCRVYVSWTPPMVPTVVCNPSSISADILVTVTNPAVTGGAPVTSYNDVYISSPLDPEYRAATLLPPNSAWLWRTPASGRAYTIKARAIGTNGTNSSST